MKDPVICYMDETAWTHELGFDKHGTTLYLNVEDLERKNECVKIKSCGIVKVEVKFLEVVRKGDVAKGIEEMKTEALKTVEGIDLNASSGYRSFETHKSLSYREVILGQKALDRANATGDFEGWVHCDGPGDMFLGTLGEDLKMQKLLEANGVDFFEGTIVVSDYDVRDVYKRETGRSLPDERELKARESGD